MDAAACASALRPDVVAVCATAFEEVCVVRWGTVMELEFGRVALVNAGDFPFCPNPSLFPTTSTTVFSAMVL